MRHFAPLLLSAFAPVAVADDLKAPTPGGPSPAAALVGQLGHPDFHTREAAGKKLLALGERALSALDTGRDSPIPEVAERCHTLAAAVRQRLDTDDLLAPTLVELPEGEQTLRMVFDALNTQSRYWLRIEGDQAVLSQRVKLAGGRRTFWEAVLAVCEAAKLELMATDAMPHSATRDRPAVVGTVWLAAATDRP
nr:hypothetical protein [Fimbriiglobus sp.]